MQAPFNRGRTEIYGIKPVPQGGDFRSLRKGLAGLPVRRACNTLDSPTNVGLPMKGVAHKGTK